jgi:hypothetical protein
MPVTQVTWLGVHREKIFKIQRKVFDQPYVVRCASLLFLASRLTAAPRLVHEVHYRRARIRYIYFLFVHDAPPSSNGRRVNVTFKEAMFLFATTSWKRLRAGRAVLNPTKVRSMTT